MQDKAVVAFSNDVVTADNAAVKLGKLVQICCGILYGDDGAEFVVDGSLRYNGFTELIDEIGDKVVVFCPLRSVQEWLKAALVKDGYDVAMVNGDTPKSERNEIFHNFQHTDAIRVLLAHPRTAAHGLTLTRAKDIIWYAPIYSLEQYEQANARIRRITTEGKTNVWHLYGTPFEKELYRRLQLKKRVLGDFLNLVRGVNDEL
jgi:SNF2 family DNA or RNA helicase